MFTLQTINEVKKVVLKWKKNGETIGFVPTMGALHIGHESLIEESVKNCDRTVVSIFVNPTQFGPNEDLDKYPRTLEQDKTICQQNNVDLVFAPCVSELYPQGQEKSNITFVIPPLNFENKMCGNNREGHFKGVTTIVAKLFNIVQADKAFFGQKDAQQLAIIKKMVADLNMPVEIIGCPIKKKS